MPSVPRRSDEQVQLRGIPSVQLSTDAPDMGASQAAAGQAFQGLTEGMRDAVIKVQRDADQTIVSDSVAKLTQKKIEIANQKKQLQGLSALSATEEAQKEYNDYLGSVKSGTLESKDNPRPLNSRQAYLVDQHSKQIWTDLFSHTEGHAAQQRGAMKVAAEQEQQRAYVGDAALNAFDPMKIEGRAGVIEKVKAAHADWLKDKQAGGTDEEKKIFSELADARLKGHLGQVHEAVIKQLISGHRDEQAKQYFERHNKEMTGEAAAQMAGVVEAADLRSTVDRTSREIYAKAGGDERKANRLVDGSGLSGKAAEEVQRAVSARFKRDAAAIDGHQNTLYVKALDQLQRDREKDPFISVSQSVDPAILGEMNAQTVATLEGIGSKSGLDKYYTDFVAMGPEVAKLTRQQMDAMRAEMSPAYRDNALARWEAYAEAERTGKNEKRDTLLTNDELLNNRMIVSGLEDLVRPNEKLSDDEKKERAVIQLQADKALEDWNRANPGKRATVEDKQQVFDSAIKDRVFTKGRVYGYNPLRPEAASEEQRRLAIIPYDEAASDPRMRTRFNSILNSLRARGFRGQSNTAIMDNQAVRSRVERAAAYMSLNRINNPEDPTVLKILAGQAE